jgi:Protein of unknown function (DUF2939)
VKKFLISLVVIFVVGYCIYPYLTLARIDRAIRNRDVAELEVLFDWVALRASAKADFKALIMSSVDSKKRGGLEALGSALGMVMGSAMIDSMIDAALSPTGILKQIEERQAEMPSILDFTRYAFFASPTEFRVDLRRPEAEREYTFTALMTLTGLTRRVSRIVLPIAAIQEFQKKQGESKR